ncbi:hypothetical protein [Symbioplanes lichenis]|uniref:hypothetical protein n=1 Tax=Symbioplanes lichenis TaxID=1629072 RepID=UPI002739CCB8|nr:hypothetical protein [Actinoplanes lichenis]
MLAVAAGIGRVALIGLRGDDAACSRRSETGQAFGVANSVVAAVADDIWQEHKAVLARIGRAGAGYRLIMVETTDDGRYIVVDGRRWRATDPAIPEEAGARLRKALMAARRDVGAALRAGRNPKPARARVQIAKVALGERGTPWWEQSDDERRARWERGLRELAPSDSGESART